MIPLTCPMCRTPLSLVTRHTPPPLTIEQRLYVWLFDLILDKTATAAEKVRAREIMVMLGIGKSCRRDTPPPRGSKHGSFGDWIRLVISERAGD